MGYNTKGRQAVLSLFKNKEGVVSADEIVRACVPEGVGKSTVYRQLGELCEEGLLVRFRSDDGRYNYKKNRESGECSCVFHLKCRKCGTETHLDCLQSGNLISHIEKEHGFCVDESSTVLYGICDRCRRDGK